MINVITADDLVLVRHLNSIHYENLGMTGIVSEKERREFLDLRNRLKGLSDFFKSKYDDEYGEFSSENSTGNPVGLGGRLRRVWSGVFKGSENKQYAAQVSFVINSEGGCLDVGFYFGRASAYRLKAEDRQRLESELLSTGTLLSGEILKEGPLQKRYYDLFELGFRAEIKNAVVSPERWLENAGKNPGYSSVIASIYPNSLGYIDMETIDFYASMVMPLMSVIPERIGDPESNKRKKAYALTPEQWAKRAERLAQIGLDGERYVMEHEKKRLAAGNISKTGYPCHKALESMEERYDILTCGPQGEDIFIEVKTTTMAKGHPRSRTFFLSSREFQFYMKNKVSYRLYRVWSVYDEPSVEEINMENVELETEGFRVTIKDYI